MIQYILLGLCLVVIFLWHPMTERMTNADVAKKQEFHASKPLKWETVPSKSTHKKADTGEQIYGPEIPAPGKDEPQPAPIKDHGTEVKYVYPTVLGPEQKKAPRQASTDSSTPLDEPSYTPAAEFPAGPAEPMPFLTDFSKILNDN